MEVVIGEINEELIHLYDNLTSDIDIRAQKCDLNDKKICELYFDLIDAVKVTLDNSMDQINDFLKIKSNLETLKDLSKEEIKRKILKTSCHYIDKDELVKNLKDIHENRIGILVICDWYLSKNQCNFLNNMLCFEKVKLCLDQVNFKIS